MELENIEKLLKENLPTLEGEDLKKVATTFKNTIENEQKKTFAEAQKQAYNNIDEQLNVLGYEKPENSKTSNFVIDLISKHKTIEKDFETKLKKSKTTDDVQVKDLTTQIEALQNSIAEKENDFKTKLESKTAESQKELKKLAILSSFPNIQTDVDAGVYNILKEKAVNDLSKMSTYENGKLTFRDKDNNILLNSQNQNEPKTTSDMLNSLDYMKSVLTGNPTKKVELEGEEAKKSVDLQYKELEEKGYSANEIYDIMKKKK